MMDDITSNITFIVKKTFELQKSEILQINNLYNKIFGSYIKIPRTEKDFITRFSSNEKKYSFHGLMKINDKIIGSYPVIPNKFKYFDKDYFFGLVVDTMIDKNYQGDLENLIKLNNVVYDELKREKIYFVYGIANQNYYKIIKNLLLYKDICFLESFIKPIRIENNSIFLILFNLMIKIYNLIINIINIKQNSNIIKRNIYQTNLINDEKNFKLFSNVEIVNYKKITFAYKINNEKKFNKVFKNLYIFNIYPFSKSNMSDVINYCSKNFKDVELIIFTKNGNEKSLNLFKLPNFLIKNKTIISGKILENSVISEDIFKCDNWNFNLSAFDIK